MNKAILIGRLTRDPETRYTASGDAFTTFTLAVDRGFTSADGVTADFFDIITWRKLAENCGKFLGKGLKAAVIGRLEIRSYEGSDGVKRKALQLVADEVEFLEWKENSGSASEQTFDKHEPASSDDDYNDLPF